MGNSPKKNKATNLEELFDQYEAERPKYGMDSMASILKELYGDSISDMLKTNPLLRRISKKDKKTK